MFRCCIDELKQLCRNYLFEKAFLIFSKSSSMCRYPRSLRASLPHCISDFSKLGSVLNYTPYNTDISMRVEGSAQRDSDGTHCDGTCCDPLYTASHQVRGYVLQCMSSAQSNLLTFAFHFPYLLFSCASPLAPIFPAWQW